VRVERQGAFVETRFITRDARCAFVETRFVTRDGRCSSVTLSVAHSKSSGPVTRLVPIVVDALEPRWPALRQRIQPPVNRHGHEHLALGRVYPALRIQANLLPTASIVIMNLSAIFKAGPTTRRGGRVFA
jgi:hypothetical protein